MLSRRDVLTGAAALGVGGLLRPAEAVLSLPKRKFRFVHFTDVHIEPERGAPSGTALAVRKLLALRPRPDFVIVGGDHVMDALSVGRERADVQFRLVAEALKPLEVPVHSIVGNHDVFGWGNKDATQNDPLYGKKMIEERVLKGPSYYSFDFGGWHFTLLDSIQPVDGNGWHATIDDAQLAWLDRDLASAGTAPKVVVTHVPALTLYPQYRISTMAAPNDELILRNGRDIQSLCQKHGVRAVLQGHTHVVESCDYAGTRYVTGGAVCGNWWKGWLFGVHPEGFMVFDVDGDALSNRYVPSGWKAQA